MFNDHDDSLMRRAAGDDSGSWDASLAAVLDDDHGELVRLYSDLADSIDGGSGKQTVFEKLERLIASVTDHFAHEEVVMRRIRWPDLLFHRQDHEGFIQDLEDFRTNVGENAYRPDDWSAVAKYLKYRFVRHGQFYDNRLLLELRS